MTTTLHKLYHAQAGLCWYCEDPTWLPVSGESKLAAMIRLGIEPGVYGSKTRLRARRATIEHLKRRADGGTKNDGVVMACAHCNASRGERTPAQHRAHVRAGQAPQDIRALLRDCRAALAEDARLLLESHCLLDGALEPIVSTMDDDARREYDRVDDLIRRIDAVLLARAAA